MLRKSANTSFFLFGVVFPGGEPDGCFSGVQTRFFDFMVTA
ncbi:hypothetical protein PR001_g23273 [Phytophthora rubi]|uniref:Uncharacterized protein n=1 Tax=Phytophthora rubi TaxID=129364 RepID=A0A6A3INJ8_9STRA|nr:hypothetical protein PR002_g23580 [Phytophthora rubi]KAE8984085.1 hypothetical protein PR001_g23273 [Phytophthora rubi]